MTTININEGDYVRETIEVPDEPIEGLVAGDDKDYRSILEVWSKLFEPLEEMRKDPVTPNWAIRITSHYGNIELREMENFRDRYFHVALEMAAILQATIDANEDCLKVYSAEEDRDLNGGLYFQVLVDWQLNLLQHELEWDCISKSAGVDIAVMGEIHNLLFGDMGLAGHLNSINYELSDDDQQNMAQALNEAREAYTRAE